jgi:hypothetical protein
MADFFPRGVYRFDDPREILYPASGDPVSSFAIYHNLDRLSATIQARRFDLVLGRQPIAWGAARVVNPTDLLTPFAYDQLDIEDRFGVDAARLRVPFGFMGEFDAGYVAGEDWEWAQSAVFGRLKFYVARTDISVIACRFREHLLLGGDLTRSVGGAGVWLEIAQVQVREREERTTDDDYFRASAGADYNFADGLYGFLEYHFNGAGSDDVDAYWTLYNHPAYTDGSVYLLARHYVTPGLAYQITPLLISSAEALINLSDGSALAVPGLEYNIAEDIYLQLGGYFAIGPRPESRESVIAPGRTEVGIQSEFGNYSHTIFSSFRIYF